MPDVIWVRAVKKSVANCLDAKSELGVWPVREDQRDVPSSC